MAIALILINGSAPPERDINAFEMTTSASSVIETKGDPSTRFVPNKLTWVSNVSPTINPPHLAPPPVEEMVE